MTEVTATSPLVRVQTSLVRQGMMQQMGVYLIAAEAGRCELGLPYSDRVAQQQGSFHGGAMGALADIAGGYAALTVAPLEAEVTTVEYKINFLTAKSGGEIHAIGRVLKAGKRLIITQADVFHIDPNGTRTLCAVMQQTIAPVQKHY